MLQKCSFEASMGSDWQIHALYSRMQTLDVVTGTSRPSTLAVIRTSVSQSGCRSLYDGLSAAILRQMTYSLVRFGAYEKMKLQLSREGPPSTMSLLLAASAAGGLGGIAGNAAGNNEISMLSNLMTSNVG